jgi:hypothetical protein
MTKHETFDKDGKPINDTIIPDGGIVRVPVTLMDASTMRKLAASANLTDSQKGAFADALNAGQSVADALQLAKGIQTLPPVMHAPGQVVLSDADRDARQKLYDERKAKLSEQWRDPPAVDTSQKPAPTMPTNDAEVAYAARINRLENAWRK